MHSQRSSWLSCLLLISALSLSSLHLDVSFLSKILIKLKNTGLQVAFRAPHFFSLSTSFRQIFGKVQEYVILGKKYSIHMCIFVITLGMRWTVKIPYDSSCVRGNWRGTGRREGWKGGSVEGRESGCLRCVEIILFN